MTAAVPDQVVDFYNELFDRVFAQPFRGRIENRLKRNAVLRQVEEVADAASQSLTRFLVNEKVLATKVQQIFGGLASLSGKIGIEDISNSNASPETLSESLLPIVPCPKVVLDSGHDAVYRVTLHSIVQVLMLVGPVMAEWQKLSFSNTFELPRRVTDRLNQISLVHSSISWVEAARLPPTLTTNSPIGIIFCSGSTESKLVRCA
jgi:hypothetical protein